MFICEYYVAANGSVPVKEFIDALDRRTRAKFWAKIELLEDFGNRLPAPHCKYIKDGIYEFRFIGIEGHIRILYFFFREKRIILTNGFIKKRNKLPISEIEKAISYKGDYLSRYGRKRNEKRK